MASPLESLGVCSTLFTVPGVSIHGSGRVTAVESTAAEVNLPKRVAGPAPIYFIPASLPFCYFPISFPLSILLPHPSMLHQHPMLQKKSESRQQRSQEMAT